jgi:hypothetical protein
MIDIDVFYKGAILLAVIELIFWLTFGTSIWLVMKKRLLKRGDDKQ